MHPYLHRHGTLEGGTNHDREQVIMMTNTTHTVKPIKVVFRKSKSKARSGGAAVSGILSAEVIARFNLDASAVGAECEGLVALLPYHPLSPGQKSKDMVAVLHPDGSRSVAHWPTMIRDTQQTTEDDYSQFLEDMVAHGYEPEVIEANQVNALLRRAERKVASKVDDEQPTFEVENISIEGSITGDLDTWNNSTFQEDWA